MAEKIKEIEVTKITTNEAPHSGMQAISDDELGESVSGGFGWSDITSGVKNFANKAYNAVKPVGEMAIGIVKENKDKIISGVSTFAKNVVGQSEIANKAIDLVEGEARKRL